VAVGAMNERVGKKAGRAVGAIKRHQNNNVPAGSHTEERASTVFAAKVCHAIEIAIAARDEDGRRRPGPERSQSDELARGSDSEHRAPIDQASSGRRAIEISVGTLHQPGQGPDAIVATAE